jgi:hypothetical protein
MKERVKFIFIVLFILSIGIFLGLCFQSDKLQNKFSQILDIKDSPAAPLSVKLSNTENNRFITENTEADNFELLEYGDFIFTSLKINSSLVAAAKESGVKTNLIADLVKDFNFYGNELANIISKKDKMIFVYRKSDEKILLGMIKSKDQELKTYFLKQDSAILSETIKILINKNNYFAKKYLLDKLEITPETQVLKMSNIFPSFAKLFGKTKGEFQKQSEFTEEFTKKFIYLTSPNQYRLELDSDSRSLEINYNPEKEAFSLIHNDCEFTRKSNFNFRNYHRFEAKDFKSYNNYALLPKITVDYQISVGEPYEAVNGFGAKFVVENIDTKEIAIISKQLSYAKCESNNKDGLVISTYKASAPEAREISRFLKTYVLFEPITSKLNFETNKDKLLIKQNSYFESSEYQKPNFTKPRKSNYHGYFLNVNIKEIGVYDKRSSNIIMKKIF